MKRVHPVLRVTLLSLALAFAGGAIAASPADFPITPPAPAPAPKLSVPTPSLQTLANGLRVISVQRDRLPLVTAQLLLRSGGEQDPSDKAGLAALTATLLTKGAAGKTAPQIAAEAEALGGSLDAAAGWDSSGVGITVTTPKLPQALALLADVVRHPDFSADELKRAQTQAIDELRLSLSEPSSLARLAAARAVFGSGAYGHSRGGTPASLAKLTRDDVQALHAALYRPTTPSWCSPATSPRPRPRNWRRRVSATGRPRPAALPAPPMGLGAAALPTLLVIDQHGAGQAGVVAAHVAPPRNDAGYYAGTVANAVLGGSYSARLNEEIRIKRGLSYGAGSDLDTRRNAGVWLASAQTKNPSAPQVVELMLGEFARLGSTPVPADELTARKATLIGGYGRSLETTAGLAGQVGDLAVHDVDLGEVGRFVERVQAVTPAQIQAYATAHLDAGDMHVVVAGDAAQFADALRAKRPDAKVLQADTLDFDSVTLQAPPPAK